MLFIRNLPYKFVETPKTITMAAQGDNVCSVEIFKARYTFPKIFSKRSCLWEIITHFISARGTESEDEAPRVVALLFSLPFAVRLKKFRKMKPLDLSEPLSTDPEMYPESFEELAVLRCFEYSGRQSPSVALYAFLNMSGLAISE